MGNKRCESMTLDLWTCLAIISMLSAGCCCPEFVQTQKPNTLLMQVLNPSSHVLCTYTYIGPLALCFCS